MNKIIFCLALSCTALSGSAVAQQGIPFQFTSEDDNRLIRENDSVKLYVASGDTTNTVSLNEETSWYRLLNRDRKVIAEGAYIADGDKFIQDGRWTAYYDNGKVKQAGAYKRNMQIGTWTEYYSSGKPKTIANYAYVIYKGEPASGLSGTWQDYYQGGRLKTSGYYATTVAVYKDTVTVDDPVSGSKVYKTVSHTELRSDKTGRWEYYTETGELDRKEDL